MIPIRFFTAYRALYRKPMLKQGETVLISGGGGGVGVAAIQLAKSTNARVCTTVVSKEKANRVRQLGAEVAINYREQDFVAKVQKATDGKGVNVIIENVAADDFARDFIVRAPNGRIVLIGSGTCRATDASFGALFKTRRYTG
jgi:NADPH2:quinone reductase